jgi:hypothetical protein
MDGEKGGWMGGIWTVRERKEGVLELRVRRGLLK